MRAGILILALCASVSPSFAQQISRDGDVERLVIAPGSDAKAWAAEEATMTSGPEYAKDGIASLRFHVDVDYHAGEKEYPIGWPRASRPLTESWRQDWSPFDFLRFWVYATTSRERLPATPLGIVLYLSDLSEPSDKSSQSDKTVKPRKHEQSLPTPLKDQWVQIEIPLWTIPHLGKVTRIQFFISESDYADHDAIDFYISDVSLVRYAAPRLQDLRVHPAVLFSNCGALIAEFRALGIAPDETVTGRLTLLADGREARRVAKPMKRGLNQLVLDLGAANLPEGKYTVRAQLGNGVAEERNVRIVASPWSD